MNSAHKISSLTAIVIAFGSLSGVMNAAVTLTVSEHAGGGIILEASGTINTANLGGLAFDSNTGSQRAFFTQSTAIFEPMFAYDQYSTPNAITTNFTSSDSFNFDLATRDFGVRNNGFNAGSGSIQLFSPLIANDNIKLTAVLQYDFKMYDADGDINDWRDLTWEWDSNGNAQGGETISLVVNAPAIPEPSSVILLGLGALCLSSRRRIR